MYVAYVTPPLIPCLWPNHQMVTTFFPVKPGPSVDRPGTGDRKLGHLWAQ